MVIGGHLGHNDQEVVEFKIFGDKRKTTTKTSTLDSGRAHFRLLRKLVSEVPWETAFLVPPPKSTEQANTKCWRGKQGGAEGQTG